MSRIVKYFQNLLGGGFDEDFYIGEIEELKLEVRELNQVIHEKNQKLNKMSYELDYAKKEATEVMKSNENGTKLDTTLLEKLGEEIKARDIKIKTLTDEIDKLKIQNNLLNSSALSATPVYTSLEELQINYKLTIADFFSERKFESFKKTCEHKRIFYVEELKNLDFSALKLTKTKIENAKMRYQDYLDKNFDEATVLYLQHGDQISKVFFRYRSFVRYCQNNDLNYISELENFDFNSLTEHEFSLSQIDKLLKKYNEYVKLKKK